MEALKLRQIRIPYWYLLIGPMLCLGIGFFLNAFVMAANYGQMPDLAPSACSFVPDINTQDDPIHVCMTHATHFKFLADWIVINHLGTASPGDFLEWFYEYTQMPFFIAWIALMIKDHSEYFAFSKDND